MGQFISFVKLSNNYFVLLQVKHGFMDEHIIKRNQVTGKVIEKKSSQVLAFQL